MNAIPGHIQHAEFPSMPTSRARPRTIDEYLAGVDRQSRAALQKVRRAVRAAAPAAEECISYGMPAFRLNGKLIAGFRASANHCSFHPMSGDTVATLKTELAGYDTSKGTIRFSGSSGLPADLVRRLIAARIAEFTKPDATGGRPVARPIRSGA